MWAMIFATIVLLMPVDAIADSFVIESGSWVVQRVVGTTGIGSSFHLEAPGFVGDGQAQAFVVSQFPPGSDAFNALAGVPFTYRVEQEGPFQGGQLGGIGIFQVHGEPVFVDIIVDPATKNSYSFTLSGSGIVPPTP